MARDLPHYATLIESSTSAAASKAQNYSRRVTFRDARCKFYSGIVNSKYIINLLKNYPERIMAALHREILQRPIGQYTERCTRETSLPSLLRKHNALQVSAMQRKMIANSARYA